MKRFLPWLLVLATFSSPTWADKFYRWVDDEGVTHYGESAPQGAEATEIHTRRAPPSVEDVNGNRGSRDSADESDGAAPEESPAPADNPETDEQASAEHEENCEAHRKNLQILENRPRVRAEDPETGELRYLDEEEREEMLEQTREEIEANCN